MKVELTPDAAQWVRAEIDSGRFPSAEEALRHAIEAAKLVRLQAELAAAEAEGGTFSGEDVRQFARQYLDSLPGTARGV